MSMGRRVVVTGVGMVSPLGIGLSSNWPRLLNPSDSGISPNVFPHLPSKVAGKLRDFPFESLKRGSQMCSLAVEEALQDSSCLEGSLQKDRIGVAIGLAMPDLQYIGEVFGLLSNGKARKISPFFIPNILPNHGSSVSIKYGFMGPLHSVSTACATGSHAIGDAFRFIREGDADVMVAGGVDSSLNDISVMGFSRLRALSTRINDPSASRPFDKDRDGFVISEGAGMLILEDLEHALGRKAPQIYCEVLGYGLSGDANHITASREDGRGSALAIKAALGKRDPSRLAYVNAHATSTPLGDKAEMKALQSVFKEGIRVTANKGHIGHLLGAAGAVECGFVASSLLHNVIPPTANIQNLDEDILGDGIIRVVQKPEVFDPLTTPYVLKNSFGFGGYNASLLFSSYE